MEPLQHRSHPDQHRPGRTQLLLGISVFWLALSMLFDGLNTLVLPNRLLVLAGDRGDVMGEATVLGLLTFVGLLAGMTVQPVAGIWSDRMRPRWGRRGALGLGLLLTLAALAVFGTAPGLAGLALGYLLVQVAASMAQAAQQGFIPDLIPTERRGAAAGLKGFMDVGGAMLGFMLLGALLGEGKAGPALLMIATVLIALYVLTVVLVREPVVAHAVPSCTSLRDAFRLDLAQPTNARFARLVLARFLFLLATYAVGRFFLYFVADRLGLNPANAADEAGSLLAGLALVTVLAAPPAGWAADRWGRGTVMAAGAVLSMVGVLLLIPAGSAATILLGGGVMALGTAAFASANWASTADVAPAAEAARYFGLANFGTAGAAAAAGLFGPVVDWANRHWPGGGYNVLFVVAALLFVASVSPLVPTRTGLGRDRRGEREHSATEAG